MSLSEFADSIPQLADRRHNIPLHIQLQQLARKTVSDPNIFVSNDQAARQAAILMLPDILSVLVKDLNPLILAIRHPQQALRIHRDPMSFRELPWFRASAAPGLDKFPVLIELQDARVSAIAFRRVPLDHKDVTVAPKGQVVGLIEAVRSGRLVPLARLPFRPER